MKDFIKGFGYAGKGVFYCFAHERNMRVHLCFTLYMFGFLALYDFFEISKAEYAVLLALCALVLTAEAVNTAVERAVDTATEEITETARISKDAAAGAVLISAVFSIIAGIVIMYQPEAFHKMRIYYADHPATLAVLIASIALSFVFVFLPSYIIKRRKGGKNK